MYNSPLQYCAECKQYIELDQTREQCAARNGCDVALCPHAHLFRPPVHSETTGRTPQDTKLQGNNDGADPRQEPGTR
jgi:hypothetical protein